MDPDRLTALDELFARALDVEAPARAAWIAEACRGRDDLRADLEALLASHEPAAAFFDDLGARIGRGSGLEIEAAARSGLRIGPYRLVRPIGRGGMGAVFLAERVDGQFEQQVALKLLAIDADGDRAVERFLNERRIIAALSHPSIARLLDGGLSEDGRPYFTMEYVDGQPVTSWAAARRLPVPGRLRLFLRITDAVQYAHRNLVVHRDLKPTNVLVTADGGVKLLDFGIAKLIDRPTLTRTQDAAFTPAYAAPEQVRGEPATTLTDVFGLGVLLYELLTGQRPFAAATPGEIERLILEAEPARPSAAAGDAAVRRALTGDLDTICLEALQKAPERRYQSVEQLSADIGRYLEGRPVQARADSVSYRFGKFVRRHTVGAAVTAGAVLLLLATGLVLSLQAARLARERDKAQQMVSLLVDLFAVTDPTEARAASLSARDVLARGTARVEARLQGQPDAEAALLDVLARVHLNLGLYDTAESLQKRALDLHDTLEGSGSPVVADGTARLGEIQRLKGDLPAAEATLRRAVSQRESLGATGLAYAVTLNHLGKVLIARSRLDEAETILADALARARREGPAGETEVAEALNNLGVARFSRADLPAAEQHFREALEIRRRVLGPDHPLVPASLNNLATIYNRRGDTAAAAAAYREAIDLYRRLLGPEDPRLATTTNNLGLLLFREKNIAAAEPLMREVLAIRRKVLPAGHSDIAQSLTNLGVLLIEARRAGEAEPLLQEALAIRRAALGGDHPLTGASLHNAGLAARALGRHAEGTALLQQALAIQEKALKPDHPELVATRQALAAR